MVIIRSKMIPPSILYNQLSKTLVFMSSLTYLSAYSLQIQSKVQQLIDENSLSRYLLAKYPKSHDFGNDKALRNYAMAIKNQYMKKSDHLSQIKYDDKIHVINNALGLHTYVSRVQGSKLKRKNEIRIGNLFKKVPEKFLNMIVVHELAHIKEKEHNKRFYKLCEYMLPEYHQLELDLRIYLTHLNMNDDIYR